jgi:hypothetical protein
MFVLNPDPYLLPCYRISPFTTKDLHTNNAFPNSNSLDDYLDARFKGLDYIYTADGKRAINIALQQYDLKPDDVVTIFTTSGNFYISGCVTKEIEKFCRWSRKMEEHTKLIFINHEFGYPYQRISELRKYNLPIIEDCAHSFFSTNADDSVGNTGDFVIYSFPKMFPVQAGGLLTSKKHVANVETINGDLQQHLKNVLSYYIEKKDTIIHQRLINYRYLASSLAGEDFEERFDLKEGIVPGVFMFRVKNNNIDLPKLKEHFYAHGIQCSVFYGEPSFFIPVHQNLSTTDLDYFTEVIQFYVKANRCEL